ncbi:MAG: HEAT repeat domain-containing protein [Phycisphaerales bacterium]
MLKSRLYPILVVALLLACAGQTLAQTVAAKGDEPKLIAVLKDSGAPLKTKIDACRQLAIVGSKDSIAPLAALLGDEQLSHMARYALQTNPDPAVDEALRAALGTVKGKPLVGVIHTVGFRRDAKAVGTLASLVNSGNAMVVGAAGRALGDIGNVEAAEVLEQARSKVPAECRLDVYEGLLRCAESLGSEGNKPAALEIYDRLYKLDAPHQVRGGALKAAILSREPADRATLVRMQLGNEDYILFSAAVEASQQMRNSETTAMLTGAMKALPADRQILVIETLGVRGDKEAAPALVDAAKDGDPRVRVVAIQTLTELADASAVPVLLQLLDDGNPQIAKAAFEGLATFPGKEADGVVTQMFAGADEGKQRLALDLMGRRRMTSAVPSLVKAAGGADSAVRANAIRMIGDLGGPDQLPAMFDLLGGVKDSQDLAAVEQAITAICLKTPDSKSEADMLIGRLGTAQPAQKMVILRVLGAVGGPDALKAVHASIASDNADVRSTAVRTLGSWKTADAAPILLRLAKETSSASERTLFLRGYLNLAARGDLSVEDRLAMCRQAAELIERDEEKRLLIGTLGNVESPDAVALIAPYVDDAATRQEASLAVVKVAEKLLDGDGPAPFAGKLVPSLEKASQAASDERLANRAKAVLQKAKGKAGAR